MMAVLDTSAIASLTVSPARSLPVACISGLHKNRQFLYCQAEHRESECDDGERYSHFRPTRNVMRPGGSFHARNAHIQAVGNEAEYNQHRATIKTRRILVEARLKKQHGRQQHEHDF